MTRPMYALREAALWIAAVIGTICLLGAVAAVAFGMTPLIFRSGSMSPGIPTGSLGISVSTPADDLAVGDIVSIVKADGTRVTHRLVATEAVGGGAFELTTRGDANDENDSETTTVTEVDRMLWSLPGAGYALQEVTKPQWVFALGVVVGILVILVYRGAREPVEFAAKPARLPDPPPRHAAASRHTGRAGAAGVASVAVLALAASLLANSPTGTLASFTDTGGADATFSTTTVQPPPTPLGCVITGLTKTATFSWTAPATGPTPTSYLVTWSGAASGSQVVTPPTMSISFTAGLLALGTTTVTVQSRYPTNWVSTGTSRSVTFVTSLIANCGPE